MARGSRACSAGGRLDFFVRDLRRRACGWQLATLLHAARRSAGGTEQHGTRLGSSGRCGSNGVAGWCGPTGVAGWCGSIGVVGRRPFYSGVGDTARLLDGGSGGQRGFTVGGVRLKNDARKRRRRKRFGLGLRMATNSDHSRLPARTTMLRLGVTNEESGRRRLLGGVGLGCEKRNVLLIKPIYVLGALTMDKGWMKLRNKFSIEVWNDIYLLFEYPPTTQNECIIESQLALEEEETEEVRLEDEMSRNIVVDIEQDTTNIFEDLLNEAHNELFVEYQMLSTFKEFRDNYHRHFKKCSDPEEACANPPHILVGRMENWHYLCDTYMSRAFQKQSWTNKTTRQKQPYNHSSGLKSFLQ
ncbi:CACTA en-spm transposon protein [Cucumis melo var. makuwa]|uniref:CACTA en-spm transposon protein n=1 Tax=Cucumis melo var. makuwa TaxID=1194695 RepID=A0A5D3BUB1_CUCMM|nr:CACTA en-spm transposon protein [Cucumis melo var. makuwa]TYK02764.1 CACTA en-spm transposon protein [Cucumis melo var. makuwa]